MLLRVSLPCRTSHTQIGSWKHLNTTSVQEPSKYSQCGLGRGLPASGSSLGFPVLSARTDGYDLALPLFLFNACACEKFIGEPQVLTLFLKRRWKGEVIGSRCSGLSEELQPIAFHNRAEKSLARWVQGLTECRTQDNGQENTPRCLFF